MNRDCATVQDDLKAFADRELPPLQWLPVRWHLLRCPACREEVHAMEQTSEELRVLEPGSEAGTAALDPALRSRILSSLPAAAPLEPEPAPTRRTTFDPMGLAGLAGAVALVLLVFVGSLTVMGHRISNTFSSATTQLSDSFANDIPSVPPPAVTDESARASMGHRLAARESDNAGSAASSPAGTSTAGAAGAAAPASPASPDSLRKVHKEASIAVTVEDLEARSDAVETKVKEMGGYVASNNLTTAADGLRTAALELRVPVQQFETLLKEVAALGEVTSENLSGQDVTEQFSDAQQADDVMAHDLTVREAQLKQALANENRPHKPAPVDWQLHEEVRRLRIEAAEARARLELLRKMSDLGSISVQLREKAHHAPPGGLLQEMGDTWAEAGASFMLAVRVPLNVLIWLLAYAPLWLPVVLLWRYLSRLTGRAS